MSSPEYFKNYAYKHLGKNLIIACAYLDEYHYHEYPDEAREKAIAYFGEGGKYF